MWLISYCLYNEQSFHFAMNTTGAMKMWLLAVNIYQDYNLEIHVCCVHFLYANKETCVVYFSDN